jgi:hypothetical protein
VYKDLRQNGWFEMEPTDPVGHVSWRKRRFFLLPRAVKRRETWGREPNMPRISFDFMIFFEKFPNPFRSFCQYA